MIVVDSDGAVIAYHQMTIVIADGQCLSPNNYRHLTIVIAHRQRNLQW